MANIDEKKGGLNDGLYKSKEDSSDSSTPRLNRMTSAEILDEAALAACGYKQEFKRCVFDIRRTPHSVPTRLLSICVPTSPHTDCYLTCRLLLQRFRPVVIILRVVRCARHPPQCRLYPILLAWILRHSRPYLGLDHRFRRYPMRRQRHG